jgi:hypothetical protein
MVWVAKPTGKLCATAVAAEYSLFPAWDAWRVQIPAASSEAEEPVTVQMGCVAEVKLTARPEVAVAARPSIVPATWPVAMLEKLTVWLA